MCYNLMFLIYHEIKKVQPIYRYFLTALFHFNPEGRVTFPLSTSFLHPQQTFLFSPYPPFISRILSWTLTIISATVQMFFLCLYVSQKETRYLKVLQMSGFPARLHSCKLCNE